MKQHKNKIITLAVIVVVLAFVFWYGGDAPGLRGWTTKSDETVTEVQTDVISKEEPTESAATVQTEEIFEEETTEAETDQPSEEEKTVSAEDEASAEKVKDSPQEPQMVIDESTGKDKYLTDPVPPGKPIPVEPENAVITSEELTCTLAVRCDTILKNMDWLDVEKVDLVPADGVIFAEKTVIFYDGESVFDLLLREMKQNRIHMEFEHTPIYNSAYIEGIANLYEFDCGELSGWMYKVNNWFPNYGCSRYQLKAGDKVEWVYTCELGADVGGYYATNGN